MSKNELTDITVQLHHETPRAILVSDDGDSEKAKPGIVLVTLPHWLARERGLI